MNLWTRLSQNLCKPPLWCKIGAPKWRFNHEQQKESKSRRAGTSGKDPGTPAGKQHWKHGRYCGIRYFFTNALSGNETLIQKEIFNTNILDSVLVFPWLNVVFYDHNLPEGVGNPDQR